ncbi:SRPBCC family protein [Patulibacter defluvii]|uniref:SRPBCC family protein n=1 Tax=Patulibacter defluvii TaxID=3095358 RepID=UPI002A747743|nr:SRPBCC family protein [Patulibacter sp. DM4]
MPAHPLRHVDDQFLRDAPLVVAASVDLAATPAQVWEALGSDRMWSWLPVIDRLEWLSPRPHGPGSVRRLRLGKAVTVDEQFYRWDVEQRATFRVTSQSRPVLDALVEDFLLEPTGKGTKLTWTMAVAPRRGQRLPLGLLAPLLRPGNGFALAGIKKIL